MSVGGTEEHPGGAQLLCEPPRCPYGDPGMRLVGHSAKLPTPLLRLPGALHGPSGQWLHQGAHQGQLGHKAGPRTFGVRFLGRQEADDYDPFSTPVAHPQLLGGMYISCSLGGRICSMRLMQPAAEAKKADGASCVVLRTPILPDPVGKVA